MEGVLVIDINVFSKTIGGRISSKSFRADGVNNMADYLRVHKDGCLDPAHFKTTNKPHQDIPRLYAECCFGLAVGLAIHFETAQTADLSGVKRTHWFQRAILPREVLQLAKELHEAANVSMQEPVSDTEYSSFDAVIREKHGKRLVVYDVRTPNLIKDWLLAYPTNHRNLPGEHDIKMIILLCYENKIEII